MDKVQKYNSFNSPRYPYDSRLGEPQNRSECGESKHGRSVRNLVTTLTELAQLHCVQCSSSADITADFGLRQVVLHPLYDRQEWPCGVGSLPGLGTLRSGGGGLF
jgi:hypothetical protein